MKGFIKFLLWVVVILIAISFIRSKPKGTPWFDHAVKSTKSTWNDLKGCVHRADSIWNAEGKIHEK